MRRRTFFERQFPESTRNLNFQDRIDMCGIVGVFSRRHGVSAMVIERATRSLYHRGPDGQRQWISPDGKVALGHARLSIIDLTTGDQPIASEDERTRVVVNGEFYGFEAIQR